MTPRPTPHADLLGQLDDAIAAFYATLHPDLADQVTLMTFSEFGRRVEENDSGGTDHGTASVLFVVGDQVKGGLHGTQPSLTDLDNRGDLRVQVDFRSVYATMLTRLARHRCHADPRRDVRPARPVHQAARASRSPRRRRSPAPGRRSARPTALVQQQYLDFLGRPADAGGTAYWVRLLTTHAKTIPATIQSFLDSHEFGRSVSPAARLALACFGAPPAFDDLMAWAAWSVRAPRWPRSPRRSARSRRSSARYGSLGDGAFVAQAYQDVLGGPPRDVPDHLDAEAGRPLGHAGRCDGDAVGGSVQRHPGQAAGRRAHDLRRACCAAHRTPAASRTGWPSCGRARRRSG